MKRAQLIKNLIKEGMSEKTLANFNDKQIIDLHKRMVNEDDLESTSAPINISKTDTQGIQQAKLAKKSFSLYEKDTKMCDHCDKPMSKCTCDEKHLEEKLVGKQKKIDANHNGKIDAQDFKILKGGKKDVKEGDKKWIQKAINPKHKGKLHKELGVPQGEKIPASKLNAAIKKGGKIGKEAKLAKTLKSLHESDSDLYAKRNLHFELREAGVSDTDLESNDINELAEKHSDNPYVKTAHDLYKKVTKKDMSIASIDTTKLNEVKKWVNNLAERNLYHNFTSKGEIMELISTKLTENSAVAVGPKVKKGHNGIPEFMSYNAIKDAGPATAPTKPTTKPGTKPDTKPGPKQPFEPVPRVNPKPKAGLTK